MSKFIRNISLIFGLMILFGCSTTRYVPQGSYLLDRNYVIVNGDKHTLKDPMVANEIIADYISDKQRPNKRILGQRLSLALYNATDSSKHDWWHRLWNEKLGSPPVICDSTQIKENVRKMKLHLISTGYLNGTVSDSVVTADRRAKVYYKVKPNRPYTISYVDIDIEDPFVRELILADTTKTLIKKGNNFDTNVFREEQIRITQQLKEMGFYTFNPNSIRYDVDSSWNDNTVSVDMKLRRALSGYDPDGKPLYDMNHPIYRISRIVINTNYVDPTEKIGNNKEIVYDTMTYRGIEIVYSGKMQIKPEVLTAAVTFSPNSLYNPKDVQITNNNIRDLGFVTLLQFYPVAQNPEDIVKVTIPSIKGDDVETSEMQLECVIQCTPFKKLSMTQELEISATSLYTSAALILGYQNRNLLGGAENFSLTLRTAYELMHNTNNRNSYEIGATASFSIPRFAPSLGNVIKSQNISQKSTKLQLSYNIQERPLYHRSLFGATFGYSWANKSGARFMINPIDINFIHVPWVDSSYIKSLTNQYLINSYRSQIIPGLSAGYYYNSNPRYQESGYTIRFLTDVNGNLLSLFNSSMPTRTSEGETYHTFMGNRYAQFARASFDYAGRQSFGKTFQLGWRFFLGGAIPYGNSSAIPFERNYYAGGSSSMRGWQIRSLGPGSQPLSESIPERAKYPFVLGDMKMEGNLEFRFNIYDWLNIATFIDAGNVWVNSKAAETEEARFKFDNFHTQIAMNTGLGVRFDFSFFLLRLDWGLKLHNPNLPQGQRWLKELGISNSVLHFAVGLPF